MEIICKGNQQDCFMDSCAHNCGCPGLKEFGEKMKESQLEIKKLSDFVKYLNMRSTYVSIPERIIKEYIDYKKYKDAEL